MVAFACARAVMVPLVPNVSTRIAPGAAFARFGRDPDFS
jgi:hypothetical protein